ncbi:hypothetical protein CANARDRAFT_9689 [[Candida] arabinofermentans NRRL YB-2248]|uniref:leucine--tRNA ligase n=1 Tax=[Candida] arabinofermentans NRRL YB-2248 TaxID=983967 RepID=A0A1E4SUU3_9ASCO|nr:hypothetical protein CANARDRAFT_9689 [[Candida] arabinofermentans NRRL YB-2248]
MSKSQVVKPVVDLVSLDAKWISKWKQSTNNRSLNPKKYASIPKTKKIYSLSMFPYPSGILHMGHLRVYTIADSLARYYHLKNYDVIHPMGWDAFGLPAENAAIERNTTPNEWTSSNISKMKQQMELMLADFDWERELTTCEPEYYKWTQKLFLLLFENGLAYRKKAEINWDPIDNTVLANEQVDSNGRSWRSGAIVEKRLLEQWFLGITKFANDLNKDLDLLNDWPSKVTTMQRNWIGESHGAELKFNIETNLNLPLNSIDVFTTRSETIYSVQYLALAFDHPIVQQLSKSDHNLQKFMDNHRQQQQQQQQQYDEVSKEGYRLSNLWAINPLDSDIKVPIFVAPYVIGSYGHGAVMGCPGHDTRDYEFWLNNMGSEAKVIKTVDPIGEVDSAELPFTDKIGIMNENAGSLKGLQTDEAREKVIKMLTESGMGSHKTNYKIRDWLISRQRYWGAPIPIIHCNHCGPVAVPDEDLPVKLPKVDKLLGKGGSPLSQIPEFVNTSCPSCGDPHAKRDTDTMDTFMDSSWYMFRYIDPLNDKEMFSKEMAKKYLPIDQYIGGIEHAILHLLYTRFIAKFLKSIGMIEDGEPIKKLISQGMVHGKTYIDPTTGRFLKPNEFELNSKGEAIIKENNKIATISSEKMSKSKYNGADPEECILKHGADSTRAHILFQAPINEILDWDEKKIVGVERWLRKVLNIASTLSTRPKVTTIKPLEEYNESEIQFHNEIQNYLSSINDSFERTLSLNTVISDYMKYTNKLTLELNNNSINDQIYRSAFENLLILISPVTPTVAEESNEILNGVNSKSILLSNWPESSDLISNLISYNVMINGKMRFVHKSTPDMILNEQKCMNEIMDSEQGKKWLQDKTINKMIMKKGAVVFIVK